MPNHKCKSSKRVSMTVSYGFSSQSRIVTQSELRLLSFSFIATCYSSSQQSYWTQDTRSVSFYCNQIFYCSFLMIICSSLSISLSKSASCYCSKSIYSQMASCLGSLLSLGVIPRMFGLGLFCLSIDILSGSLSRYALMNCLSSSLTGQTMA